MAEKYELDRWAAVVCNDETAKAAAAKTAGGADGGTGPHI